MPPKRKSNFGRLTKSGERKKKAKNLHKSPVSDNDLRTPRTSSSKSTPKDRKEKSRANATPEKLRYELDADTIRKATKRLQMSEAEDADFLRVNQRTVAKCRKMPRSRLIGRQIDAETFSNCSDLDRLALSNVSKHNFGRLYDPIDGSFDPVNSEVCEFGCSAVRWKGESKFKCCADGSLELEPLWPPGDRRLKWFESLYKDYSPIANRFRKHIVPLNNALSLCSVKVKRVDPPGGNYKPAVVIQGKVAYKMGPLQSTDDPDELPPAFAQLYVMDPAYADKEFAIRCGNMYMPNSTSPKERRDTEELMLRLQREIRKVNAFVADYVMATELIAEFDPEELKLVIDADQRPSQEHNRKFNVDYKEITVLRHDDKHRNQDIVVRLRGRGNHVEVMNDTNRAVDPLRFVLMFPTGVDGWHLNQLKKCGKKNSGNCSGRMFYRYHIQIRVPFATPGNFSPLHRSGRLFQEYLCLNYAKIENQQFRWYEQNQKEVRAEKYSKAVDQFRADEDLAKIGKLIILPPSFTGGPRYMHQKYQDAVALIREMKKPDLFITVTVNPKWSEITESLLPGQQAKDRPDLVARVFKQKMDAFNRDLKEGQIFGTLRGYIYVVEFQKRGLPHMHSLFVLSEEHRIRTSAQVDAVIWAELPPDPLLFKEGPLRNLATILLNLVITHMYHTCSAGCLHQQRCKRGFPKRYCKETMWDESAMYPEYRRREGRVVKIGAKTYTNQYVVPYNPYVLLKYQCHINVECTVSMKSIKYLYMYLYKGGDRMMVSPQEKMNEIRTFENCRSIGSAEACWRIFEFRLAEQRPPVNAIRVHLENEQNVIVDANNLRRGPPITELMGFFEFNKLNPDTRVTYADFPKQYSWSSNERRWIERVQDRNTLGRIQIVHPTAGDVFYLRILLHHDHCKGKISFADMMTANNIKYSCFKDVCASLGLLQDDGEWDFALREAAHTDRSAKIRSLFVIILRFCDTTSPIALFNDHVASMTDDYEREFPVANSQNREISTTPVFPVANSQNEEISTTSVVPVANSQNKEIFTTFVLLDIEERLQLFGQSLSDFGLPTPTDNERRSVLLLRNASKNRTDSVPLQEQLNFDLAESIIARNGRLSMLNQEQKEIHDEILDVVTNHLGDDNILSDRPHFSVFIDARGGTGKTYLLNTILLSCRTLGNKKNVAIAVATSGIAATLLILGRTFHSRFKVPINNFGESVTFGLKPTSEAAKVIRAAKVIVWDEAPMTHKLNFEGLDRFLRDINSSDKPFGGKVVIFAGDFRQVLPVVRHGSTAAIADACLSKSPLFRKLLKRRLTKNLRIGDNPEFAAFDRFLLNLGNGTMPIAEAPDWVEVPKDKIFIITEAEDIPNKNKENMVKQLIDFVMIIFPNLTNRYQKFINGLGNSTDSQTWVDWLACRAILAPRNTEVDFINHEIIAHLPGAPSIALSADMCLKSDDAMNYPVELLNEMSPSGVPPHCLYLKPGIILVLLRNLNPRESLCNGTRLVVIEATQRLLHCKIASGKKSGTLVMIPRIDLKVNDSIMPIEWKRRQFPVRPAFAMTINKSQGQTLKKVGIWLMEPCFGHGQLYVASSRVGDPSHLHYAIPEWDQGLMKNVVYHQVLTDYIPEIADVQPKGAVRHMKVFSDAPDQLVEVSEEAAEPEFPKANVESDDEDEEFDFLTPSINSCQLPLETTAEIWGISVLHLKTYLSQMSGHPQSVPYSCAVDSVLDVLHHSFLPSVKRDVQNICLNNGGNFHCPCDFCSAQTLFFWHTFNYTSSRSPLLNQQDIAFLNNDIWEALIEFLPNHFGPKGKGTASNQEVPSLFLAADSEANRLWGIHRSSRPCSCGATTHDVLLPVELMGTEELKNLNALLNDAALRDGQCSVCYNMVSIESVSFKKHLIFNMEIAADLPHSMDLLPQNFEIEGKRYDLKGLVKNVGDGVNGINHFVAIILQQGKVQLLDDMRSRSIFYEKLITALRDLEMDNTILKGLSCIVYIQTE